MRKPFDELGAGSVDRQFLHGGLGEDGGVYVYAESLRPLLGPDRKCFCRPSEHSGKYHAGLHRDGIHRYLHAGPIRYARQYRGLRHWHSHRDAGDCRYAVTFVESGLREFGEAEAARRRRSCTLLPRRSPSHYQKIKNQLYGPLRDVARLTLCETAARQGIGVTSFQGQRYCFGGGGWL
jgi:hypothetical protein